MTAPSPTPSAAPPDADGSVSRHAERGPVAPNPGPRRRRTATSAGVAPSDLRADRSRSDVILLGGAIVLVWFLVIALGRAWGIAIEARGENLVLYTPPLLGGYRLDPGIGFVVPVLTALALVALLPVASARLRWRNALAVSATGSLAWWVALASVDGSEALTRGLHWGDEYAAAHPAFTSDPRQFLATFTDALPTYSVQLRGHPPGVPLLLAALDRIGLGTETWTAVITLAVAASGVVAVLIAVREVAGEDVARRAMPFLVLAPTATWMAISFDALFAGVAAWLVTLLVLATARRGWRSDALAVGAGALAAVVILFSYGLVLMGCLVLAVVVARRAWRPLAVATVAAVALTVALVPFGFWWLTGLAATTVEYHTLDVDRPYGYFLVNNLSAWFLAIGPATLVALAFLRSRRLWILVGGGLAAVVVADLSGLSNGEVERIWLPFTVWVLPAAAVLGGHRWATRGWLAAQAATAIVLAWFIQAHW